MQGNSNRVSFIAKPGENIFFTVDENFPPEYRVSGELHGKLEWNDSLKKFIYASDNGYAGEVNFTITYGGKTADISINVGNTFRPRARIIRIIGQELISNDVVALVELIKNSYDADSRNVFLRLNDIFRSSGQIEIQDDGSGMSFEKILNVWLEPATPDKRGKDEQTYSICFERRLLGEKGIGRFAVHRLGDKIELITRARTDCSGSLLEYETVVEIDWNEFSEFKYLEDIPIKINRNYSPTAFKNSSGTLIRISQIHPWKNSGAVREALMKIKGLESPVKPKNIRLHKIDPSHDPGLAIEVGSDDKELNNEINSVKSLSELLSTAFYKFSAVVDADGNIVYQYSFNRPDFPDLKRPENQQEVPLTIDDLKKYNVDWFESNPLTELNSPGPFELLFYAWDLDSVALKVAGLAEYYKTVIRKNAGVRIYRDNFRVWPYGEPDDDWLSLDLTRLNAPRERSVSRNQVFGIVHISSIDNTNLKDQSNREGLIVNQQYDQFYNLVVGAITLFAAERKKDKVNLDRTPASKNVNDSVTQKIIVLRNKIERNGHLPVYHEEVDGIQTEYNNKIEDLLERYIMAAALGISYSLPIHEMKLRLTSIKHIIEDLEANPIWQDKLLRQLSMYVDETQNILVAVTSMMSRQKRQKVSLGKVAANAHLLKETDLKKFDIIFEVTGDGEIQVDAVPGLLNTAVLNIVDNSVYWLRAAKISANKSSFKPKITIDIGLMPDKSPYMTIHDNGNGFEDPFDLLSEPYYSRKADGFGLGLFLVKEIMTRIDGRVEGYNDKGAVVRLVFNRNK